MTENKHSWVIDHLEDEIREHGYAGRESESVARYIAAVHDAVTALTRAGAPTRYQDDREVCNKCQREVVRRDATIMGAYSADVCNHGVGGDYVCGTLELAIRRVTQENDELKAKIQELTVLSVEDMHRIRKALKAQMSVHDVERGDILARCRDLQEALKRR